MFFPTTVSSSPTIKVRFGDDIRRIAVELPESSSEESAFAITRSTVISRFGFSPAEAACLSLQYLDDEGDQCTLTEASMEDLACLAAGKVWKLTAVLCGAPVTGIAGASTGISSPPPPVETMPAIPATAIQHCIAEPEEESPRFEPPPRSRSPLAELGEALSQASGDEQEPSGDTAVSSNLNDQAEVAAATSGLAQPGWKRVMKGVLRKGIWGESMTAEEKALHLLELELVEDLELANDLLRANKGDLDKVIAFLSEVSGHGDGQGYDLF